MHFVIQKTTWNQLFKAGGKHEIIGLISFLQGHLHLSLAEMHFNQQWLNPGIGLTPALTLVERKELFIPVTPSLRNHVRVLLMMISLNLRLLFSLYH